LGRGRNQSVGGGLLAADSSGFSSHFRWGQNIVPTCGGKEKKKEKRKKIQVVVKKIPERR